MGCTACVGKIDSDVEKLQGVTKVLVNPPLNKTHVLLKQMSKTRPRDVLECINGVDYSAEMALESTDQNALSKSKVDKRRKLLTTAMIFPLPDMLIHTCLYVHSPSGDGLDDARVQFGDGQVAAALPVGDARSVWRWSEILRGSVEEVCITAPGMDFLVVAGTTVSYTYSFVSMVGALLHENCMGHHFFESSAMLLTFMTLG